MFQCKDDCFEYDEGKKKIFVCLQILLMVVTILFRLTIRTSADNGYFYRAIALELV